MNRIDDLPAPPPWRQFNEEAQRRRGTTFQASPEEVEMVNAALYLRRPLLVTGRPGTGKSSIAFAVAEELGLGPVLTWPITTRSTLTDGLYAYDAIARLQDASLQREERRGQQGVEGAGPDMGHYIRLGPLGTALFPRATGTKPRPRVLLIDEIDKGDIDLPNDLLNLFEDGEFVIPELARFPDLGTVNVRSSVGVETLPVTQGRVRCEVFPFVVMTSNGEREFPPAFLRRCLRLQVVPPDAPKLARIVEEHLQPPEELRSTVDGLIREFLERRENRHLNVSTDQLLNAVYLVMKGVDPLSRDRRDLLDALLSPLSESSL